MADSYTKTGFFLVPKFRAGGSSHKPSQSCPGNDNESIKPFNSSCLGLGPLRREDHPDRWGIRMFEK
ncbi:unnamed protein product [Lupinus luteus]|uniref:Uncharacterized protein n=1 Tax=Lupinus luteus TaxID=3873 RepID=A0AAV1WJI9_LUPLU